MAKLEPAWIHTLHKHLDPKGTDLIPGPSFVKLESVYQNDKISIIGS